MALPNELISQFAKLVKEENKPDNGTTVYGKIIVDSDGQKYVKLDGSDFKTPITEEDDLSKESSTTDIKDGDRVSVMIKNHTATVTGNISSPSVRKDDAASKDEIKQIQEFDILIGEKVTANEGYIKKLQTDKANVNELQAAQADITELKAKDIEITGELTAQQAEITNIKTTKIDASVVEATYATIENLNATNIKVSKLEADFAVIDDIEADNVSIHGTLDAHKAVIDNLDTNYANIDFANIGEAAIKKLFTDSGIIKDLVVSEGHITGELVGVTIKGDLIEAGTLKADRLVVKGSDGIYYKLNVDSGATTSEKVSEEDLRNGLHGDAIIADTITANKIHVEDLVSFDATIGGFHITNDSIYSGVKMSSDSPAIGVYQGSDGQFAVGDDTNFLKFYKDEDGNYKLAVQASEIYLSSSGKNVEQAIDDTKSGIDSLKEDLSENGVSKVITKTGYSFTDDGMIVQKTNNPEMKTQITDNGMMVYKKTGFEKNSETGEEIPTFTPTLTANNKGVDAVNLNASTYLVVGGRSRFQNYGSNRTGCFWIGN